MKYNFGPDQMGRQEWLLGKLQEARQHRQSQRDFEMRRVLAGAGDMVHTAASAGGAVLGSSASIAVRGLGALAGGAGRGAIAAWGTRPSRATPKPSGTAPPRDGGEARSEARDRASEQSEVDADAESARSQIEEEI